jgi:hypothetical protein
MVDVFVAWGTSSSISPQIPSTKAGQLQLIARGNSIGTRVPNARLRRPRLRTISRSSPIQPIEALVVHRMTFAGQHPA